MPLQNEKNNAHSQSIEDLIAQLDTPVMSTVSSKNGNSNQNSNDDLEDAVSGRKVLKGKRQVSVSTGSNGIHANNNHEDKTASPASPLKPGFARASSFGNNSGEPVLVKNIIMSKKYTKHMKSLKERGSTKKGGAGGKHTWGAPGCELEEDFLDANDPNYDSSEEGVVMVCVENSEAKKPSKSNSVNDDSGSNESSLKELDADSFESEIKLIVLEYFQNGDTIEVVDQLKCYNYAKIKPQIVSYLVQIALEHNNTCKELISRLLRDLTVELFDEEDFVAGFDILLNNLPDLILDTPDAPEKVGTFIARAIADKVLAKSYLSDYQSLADFDNSDKISKALESARLLVNMNDHLFQLSHIWGNKGGFLAVKELTDKINELIQEYYDSRDVEEVIRCLKELNVPHFHHEFIFEALDFALQKGDTAIELIINLLSSLCKSVIVTYDQLKIGFTRMFAILPDVSLDVPNASSLLEKIVTECNTKGFVFADIMDLAPNKSRKRFVSEGDGGRIKEDNGH